MCLCPYCDYKGKTGAIPEADKSKNFHYGTNRVVLRVSNHHFDMSPPVRAHFRSWAATSVFTGWGVGASRVSICGSTCRSLLVTMLIRRSEYGSSLPQSMQQTYVSPARSRCGHVVFG